VTLFPDIGIQESKFPDIPLKHWFNMDNRQAFFNQFAKERGVEPLIPENWYRITSDMLLQSKGASRIQHLYKGFAEALTLSYPDIGLDKTKFTILPRYYWRDLDNQRQFFLDYAQKKGFDPLVPANWYKISAPELLLAKSAGVMLVHNKGSYVDALMKLFPTIGLERFKFSSLC